MKKIIAIGIAAAFLSGMCASAINVTVTSIAGYGNEFNVNPVIGTGYAPSVIVNGGFETFCYDERPGITIPGTYNATVNTSGIDFLGLQMTAGAAWLYQQFASGTLAGYNYTPGGGPGTGRIGSSFDLQIALWNMQNQYGPAAGTLANSFTALAVAHFGSLAATLAATTGGAFNVGILEMKDATGKNVQPMYTLLPDGGTTLMLMGIGFSGLALVSRKLRA